MPLKLRTKRLTIIPLTVEQVEMYYANDGSLERSLGLHQAKRYLNPEVREMIRNYTLPYMRDRRRNPLYVTIWIAYDRSKKLIVCSFSFKGRPNVMREIEIGYGTEPQSRGQGYMTEAVGVAILWARGDKGIHTMLAETRKRNKASICVLQHNRFEEYKRSSKAIFWKRECR